MAINIVIALTDAEQAKVSQWIDVLRPGLTNQQKLSLLQDHGRRLLRDDLVARIRQHREAEWAAQRIAEYSQDMDGFDAPTPLDTSTV